MRHELISELKRANFQYLYLAIACGLHLFAAFPADASKYGCNVDQTGFSEHSCFGETDTMRSCRFRNLYYSLDGGINGTWVYFEDPEGPPFVKRAGQTSVAYDFQAAPRTEVTDPYFYTPSFIHALSHELPWGDGKGFAFDLQQRRQPPPPPADIAMQEGVALLWGFFTFSEYSYGHCMLNDWLPMFVTLDHHFADAIPPFKIVMNRPVYPKVCLQYVGPFSQRPPPVAFDALVDDALKAGKKWLRFCDLVIGDGLYQRESINAVGSNIAPKQPSVLFNPNTWRRFRRAVYLAHGLSRHADYDGILAATAKDHISIINKEFWPPATTSPERRRILNVKELAEHLQKQFPTTTVALINFAALNATEQLLAMTNTSIFITTQGSASFRHVFLKRGARVILVGSPLSPMAKDQIVNTAFFELPRHFQVADYRIIKYPMDAAKPEWDVNMQHDPHNEAWELYCIDVTINLDRMTEFVRGALLEVAHAREWLNNI